MLSTNVILWFAEFVIVLASFILQFFSDSANVSFNMAHKKTLREEKRYLLGSTENLIPNDYQPVSSIQ